jgi:hypothetical protein
MDEDREYVESRWVNVVFIGGRNECGFISGSECSLSDWQLSEAAAWLAARQFTEEREEEIAEVEEEIATLKSLRVPMMSVAPLLRCGKRAEECLTALKKGMRP